MDYLFDRTGFPYVPLPDLGFAVSLLPLTKIQLERYLADVTPQGDRWYEDLLRLNPRVSPWRFAPEERERLFATGLLPEEAMAVAAWLGEGYRLPNLQEWRMAYRKLAHLRFAAIDRSRRISAIAAALICQLGEHLRPTTAFEASLIHGGVVEWVSSGADWIGVGAPEGRLKPNLWNPLSDEVTPVNVQIRLNYFGARLIKSIRR